DELARLAARAPLFIRAADAAEIAILAGLVRRRRRENAELHGAIDDLQHFDAGATLAIGDRDHMLGEPASGRAVPIARRLRRASRRRFHREAVNDWLEHRPAGEHRLARRSVTAGLVVGHPQSAGAVARFDEIDRSAQLEAAVDRDGI